jgi:hypothetical protein
MLKAWAAAIQQLLTREPSLQAQISAFGGWIPISVANVPAVGTEDRLIRIAGAQRPIDVFFVPNEAQYRSRLRTCSETEAISMLDRFATPEIAAFAVRKSKEDSIRAVGWRILHEMRDSGDPFAEEVIREIERERLAKAEKLLRQKRPPEQDQELDQSL